MRIALTGGTGFIGREVVRVLRLQDRDFVMVPRDAIDSPHDCYTRMGRPDVLIHLAWEGLPHYKSPHHLEHGAKQYRFLEAAIQGGLRSLLVTGTCAEYGLQSGCMTESMEAQPVHAYAQAKHELHERLMALSKPWCGLTWARLFYLWGDEQPKTCLYPALVEAVKRRRAIFPMTGGEQIRDYLHVSDVARYLVALAGADDGTVNVCSGSPRVVKDIVRQWIINNDWPIKPEFGKVPYADYEPMELWGDPSKLHRLVPNLQVKAA